MILAVALNGAVDLTYGLPRVAWCDTNRVAAVHERAGGKAVNVARVLRVWGEDVVVTGFAGGATGDALRSGLAGEGIVDALVPIAGATRRTVAVVETGSGSVTMLAEPGPTIAEPEWLALLRRVADLCGEVDAVVLSGSLPPGLHPDVYAVLARRAAAAGVPVLLDADGDALRLGVAGRPSIVTPNAAELARATGTPDPLRGAEALRAAGAESVVVSLGPGGLLAVTPEGLWCAEPPVLLDGNPTGAGDAVTAALTMGLVRGYDWPQRLAHAIAASAAAVLAPVAGELDPAAYRSLIDTARVQPYDLEEKHAARHHG